MKDFSAIAFIPARKNSKRVPGKNKRIFNGKPLFQHTAEAALMSKCYDKVILSTDDEELEELGRKIPGLTVAKRAAEYAGDEVRARDVVLYHLREERQSCDYISMLMPTTPFRDASDIRLSFNILLKDDGDSLASVVKYEFHPSLAMGIRNGRLEAYSGSEFNWTRESDFEPAYHFNGAIFTVKHELLIKTGTFIHKGTVPYVMDALKSLDIDEEIDLMYGEYLARNAKV